MWPPPPLHPATPLRGQRVLRSLSSLCFAQCDEKVNQDSKGTGSYGEAGTAVTPISQAGDGAQLAPASHPALSVHKAGARAPSRGPSPAPAPNLAESTGIGTKGVLPQPAPHPTLPPPFLLPNVTPQPGALSLLRSSGGGDSVASATDNRSLGNCICPYLPLTLYCFPGESCNHGLSANPASLLATGTGQGGGR